MGTSTLIYIIGALSAFLVINNNIIKVTSDQSTMAVGKYKAVQGRNNANSVRSLIESQVSANITTRNPNGTTVSLLGGNAFYRVVDTSVTFPDSLSLIKVQVIGTFGGDTSRMMATYKVPTTVTYKGIPTTAFTYSVSSGDSAIVDGDINVDPDNDDQDLDADVRVNRHFRHDRHHNHRHIHGHVHHNKGFDGDESQCGSDHGSNHHDDHDNSEVAPISGVNVQRDSMLKVPNFDENLCKTKVIYGKNNNYNWSHGQQYGSWYSDTTYYYFSSSQVYNISNGHGSYSNTTLTLGTDSTHPVVIYIDGNLTLNDDAIVRGYGIIIVNGSLNMGTVDFSHVGINNHRVKWFVVNDIVISGCSHNNRHRYFGFGHSGWGSGRNHGQNGCNIHSDEETDNHGKSHGHQDGHAYAFGHFFSKHHIRVYCTHIHGGLSAGESVETDDGSDVYYVPGPTTTTTSAVTVTTTSASTTTGRLTLYKIYE